MSKIFIPIISIDDLIIMKKDTGRKQDRMDIEHLLKLQGETL